MWPTDQIMDASERFLVAELIREKVFRNTHQEVPYSTAVEIEQFTEEERDDGVPFVEIFARILVERKQQKGIIIGKQGSMLKRIGTGARLEIARLLGAKVRLNLHVSVAEKWTEKQRFLNTFGIGVTKHEQSQQKMHATDRPTDDSCSRHRRTPKCGQVDPLQSLDAFAAGIGGRPARRHTRPPLWCRSRWRPPRFCSSTREASSRTPMTTSLSR